MAPKITPTGIRASEQYLSVSLSIETGNALQFGLVRVPLDWVLSDDIREALDRAYRVALATHRDGLDLQALLF